MILKRLIQLVLKKVFLEFLHPLKSTWWRRLEKSILHLIYPARCLHCKVLLPPEPSVLCIECAALLELIEPTERCATCFNCLEESSILCHDCCQYPSLYFRVASAFDYGGSAASLVKHLKYANQPYLARGMAAFLMVQFDRLEWPLPDALIPVPISFTHWLERGYNQSALLAEEMGKLLKCPVWQILKRKSGDYSQAELTLEQRKKLDGQCFRLSSSYTLKGKTLLVIDDVMTSGLTLQRCSEVLNSAQPAALYALTFCRTRFL